MTIFYPVDPGNINSEIMEQAAACIRDGKLVAFPTETVYGIGANAFDAAAVEKIYKAKRRPSSDPLIVHIADVAQLDDIVEDVPELAWQLAQAFWPGPLTLILNKTDKIPSNVTSGKPSVAVRMPSHPIAQELIRRAQRPIAAPSANLFSKPSSTSGKHVSEDFVDELDMVLDGGESTIGVESTVVNLTASVPVVLRPGGLPVEALRKFIPELQIKTSYLDEETTAASPGMLLKHYSPNARLVLYLGDDPKRVAERMKNEAEKLEADGLGIGILCSSQQGKQLNNGNRAVFELGEEGDLETISKSLYRGLRHLDEDRVDVILASAPVSSEGLGLAIRDRLYRSAEGNVVEVS